MTDIPTWHERAMAHPDHQNGMISEGMLRARMCEEIADLRAEIEKLTRERDEARAVISTLEIVGKAADDERAQLRAEVERLTRERYEARAEVARQAAEVFALMRAWRADKERLDEARKALEAKP